MWCRTGGHLHDRPMETWNSRPQQGNLGFSGPLSGRGAGSGAQTHDRRVPADLRADSLANVSLTPHFKANKGLL
ncbi:hypothetical protein PoB_003894600 [Plakobranchus ocellatus]|uniref:Uncharacterized protein n=1 Tax=Plakobranchus ocellatus TaxID=259542 RepID=A0AAV4AW74_9GAST|nr:hypothetical protein PoB_003894600 [Plakobranchus ocellatus]